MISKLILNILGYLPPNHEPTFGSFVPSGRPGLGVPNANHPPASSGDSLGDSLTFELRHEHALSTAHGHSLFRDVPSNHLDASSSRDANTFSISTRNTRAARPDSQAAFFNAWRLANRGWMTDIPWHDEDMIGPDVESREALLQLAKMTNNAYLSPNETGWYDLGSDWTVSFPVGWEPDDDGFRGHIFATPDNSTVVLSIKGTSGAVLGGGGPTAKKDKLNDNLLFSCCCARVDWTWSTVCDCYTNGWKCDQTCLENALIEDSLFYPIGINLYNNITYMYPDATIWAIGHSLGGSLAALIGATFGVPTVTFEAPGEKMAAQRLHLPSPPSVLHIHHVYHTADPIPMGTCNGVFSSCSLAGYAMESRCHQGLSIIYDTVSNLSWSVDVRTHGIVTIIERLLAEPWPPSIDAGREVPEAKEEVDCVECFSWEFGDFKNTTTSTTTDTMTSTSTTAKMKGTAHGPSSP